MNIIFSVKCVKFRHQQDIKADREIFLKSNFPYIVILNFAKWIFENAKNVSSGVGGSCCSFDIFILSFCPYLLSCPLVCKYKVVALKRHSFLAS